MMVLIGWRLEMCSWIDFFWGYFKYRRITAYRVQIELDRL
jgi:hypothetical protein